MCQTEGERYMKKILSNPVVIVLMLLVFPPLGILIMYCCSEWDSNWKLGLSVVFMILWIGSILMSISQEYQLAAQTMRFTSGCGIL